MVEKNVMRWRVDNFGQQIANDEQDNTWVSTLFWLKPSPYHNIPVYFELFDAREPGAASILLQVIDKQHFPKIWLTGDIWMEKLDGEQSQVKKVSFSVYSDDVSYSRASDVFERAELDKFKNEKTIFICIEPSIEFSVSKAFPAQWVEQRWEIQDFDQRIEMSIEPIWTSQPFALSHLFDGKFQFTCVNSDCYSLKLMDSSGSGLVNMEYQMWFENEDGQRTYKHMGHVLFSAGRNEQEFDFCSMIYERPEEPLFVCFNARLWIEKKETSTGRIDVSRLYENADFADIEICVGEVKFKASKSILCPQSEVFYRMFTNQTEEKATGIVNINHFDAQLVEKMLIFFYLGKVDDLDLWSHRLLKIADYYEIHGLIDLCVQSIAKNLTMDNFFETLVLAVQLGHIKQLRIYLLEYAKNHRQEISNHPQINDFISKNLDATRELLQLFAS
ncbi:Protein roadkill-like protein [Aphelenchoides besseyi]|nr:Protein roadkill-like protein [Aphelenchoides besseyi]KAI6229236.1 Protein roadkill-like protein [Aphelenchoides besseyi]